MARHTTEQIVQLLRQADEALAKGISVEDFCRSQTISPATYYRWKQKYSDLGIKEIKRLKVLETENAKLKRLLAEALLANDALQESLAKKT